MNKLFYYIAWKLLLSKKQKIEILGGYLYIWNNMFIIIIKSSHLWNKGSWILKEISLHHLDFVLPEEWIHEPWTDWTPLYRKICQWLLFSSARHLTPKIEITFYNNKKLCFATFIHNEDNFSFHTLITSFKKIKKKF